MWQTGCRPGETGVTQKKSALMPSGKNKVQNATLNRGRTSKYQKAQSTGNTHIALRNSTTKGKGRLGQHIYIYI